MSTQLVMVEVKGLKEVEAALSRIDQVAATSALKVGLEAGASIILAAMRNFCPVKTGALRNALRMKWQGIKRGYAQLGVGLFGVQKGVRLWRAKGGAGNLWLALGGKKKGKVRVQAIGGFGELEAGKQMYQFRNIFAAAKADVFYAKFLEFGFKNPSRPKHPFMRPAYDATKQEAADAVARAMLGVVMQAAQAAGRGEAASAQAEAWYAEHVGIRPAAAPEPSPEGVGAAIRRGSGERAGY